MSFYCDNVTHCEDWSDELDCGKENNSDGDNNISNNTKNSNSAETIIIMIIMIIIIIININKFPRSLSYYINKVCDNKRR